MIKLERAEKPAYLSDEKVLELTDFFKASGESVWNHSEIKIPLLASSHEKCAYCECCISEESKYMEVEHFRYKDKYKDLVVAWPNLLPSCKRCNIAKLDHDVEEEPIVHPYEEDPRQHLSFRLFRLRGLTEMGTSTVDTLRLNSSERMVVTRFEIGQQVERSIETAIERLDSYLEKKITVRRNKLINIVETILQECQPKAIYSATTATVALSNPEFLRVINSMKDNGIWSEELEVFHKISSTLALPLT
ncbi:HNH endonuclease [Pseudomonas putida]|uniref:HNH endonuclease n=1 Tax=Pseudomonas putida TaxID=303 RepID=UPI0034D5FB4B